MKKTKFISLIMILLNLFMLSSCVDVSEEEQKRQRLIYEKVSQIETEQDVFIVTYDGWFTKNESFYFLPIIKEELETKNIELDYNGIKTAQYFNNRVFLLVEYLYNKFMICCFDLNDFSMKYIILNDEIDHLWTSVKSYYFNDSFAVFEFGESGKNKDFIIYDYKKNIYFVVSEIEEVEEIIKDEKIVKNGTERFAPRSPQSFSYNDRNINYQIEKDTYGTKKNYNYSYIRFYEFINREVKWSWEIHYNTILENNNSLKVIDNIIKNYKANIFIYSYVQNEEIYVFCYDNYKSDYWGTLFFKCDIENQTFTYLGQWDISTSYIIYIESYEVIK